MSAGSLPSLISAAVEHRRPLLLFSLTPPRRTVPEERLDRIAQATVERLQPLDLDALILYDLTDESDRTDSERPFPYLATLDPAKFHRDHLHGWQGPTVIYRSVGKYDETELSGWFAEQDPDRVATVLVGASSGDAEVRTTLPVAQRLWRDSTAGDTGAPIPMGAVAIPERHAARFDEHERMLRKQQAGTSFFVTQVVYDVDAARDLVSDYHYGCLDAGVVAAPVIFTLSVCGSLKTLEFLQWLGVRLPRWMHNELERTDDPLAESYRQCAAIATELAEFCTRLGVPYGFNVESVSTRKVEIEASVRLAAELGDRMREGSRDA